MKLYPVIHIGAEYSLNDEIIQYMANKPAEEIKTILKSYHLRSAIRFYHEALYEREDQKMDGSAPRRMYCDKCSFIVNCCGCEHNLVFGPHEKAVDFLTELFVKQKGLCALTNKPLLFGPVPHLANASLDRINSKKYYTMSNVQWVDKTINQMKGGYSTETFRKFAKMVK